MVESKVFKPELDDRLITYVRDNPVLYDFNDSSYKNLVAKDVVWRIIAADLCRSVDECKIRWRTIRDSYKKNLRKMSANTKAGSPVLTKSKYINKNLQFLDHTFKELTMVSSFCVPIVTRGSKEKSLNSQLPDAKKPSSNSQLPEAKKQSSNLPLPELPVVVTVDSEEEEASSNVSDFNSSSEVDEPVEKKRILSSSTFETVENVVNPRRQKKKTFHTETSYPVNALAVVHTEHPLDTFFRSMAETVKTFPQHLVAETRMQVTRVVTEMEIRAIQERD